MKLNVLSKLLHKLERFHFLLNSETPVHLTFLLIGPIVVFTKFFTSDFRDTLGLLLPGVRNKA